MSAKVQRMDNWKELAIGALLVQAISSVWFYLRSIGDKVSKREHEKTIAEMEIKHEKAIAALKAELDKINAEVKGDFRRLETKIDVKLDAITNQLMLMSRDRA